ncbi:MAG: MTH1187 family thiamine-binding protein [Bacteroidales bacterium]|nr:MTH1187 family thiamine-binding protein [Bacteroidales bacterium]
MSVLVEFAMFPTDKKGESASPYVSKVIEMIRESGVPYKLGAMGTTFETETLAEAHQLIENAYKTLEPDSQRVYSIIKMDIRKGAKDRLNGKVKSIENHIGKVNS